MTHNLDNLFPLADPVPASWLSLLSSIEVATGMTPVLAGGALRDRYHSVPVKDLDIFLPYSTEAVKNVRRVFDDAGFSLFQEAHMEYEEMTDCLLVLGFRDLHGLLPDVNIIFLRENVSADHEQVVERIDFGICQIGVFLNENGVAEFYYTNAFVEDVLNKTFTLVREYDQDRSLRRFERLKQKYPNHRLVLP